MTRAIPPLMCCLPDDGEARDRIAAVLGCDRCTKLLPGSVADKCAECGIRVMLAPIQQIVKRRHPSAVIVCVSCGLPEVLLGAPVLALTLHPERMAEVS